MSAPYQAFKCADGFITIGGANEYPSLGTVVYDETALITPTGDGIFSYMIGSGLRRMLRHRRTWIWSAVAIVVGIGLGWLPLFGVLGYELAIAASLLAAACGLDLGAAFARELQTMPAPPTARAGYPGRMLAASTLGAAALATGVIVLPAIVEPPKFEFFPAVGPRSHGALDPAAIVNAVLEGVQAVNQKDATAYAVARIDYRPTTCRLRARIKCWLL